ncbi:MAG: diguanylate cyclase [Spirochaetia bacterium]
MFFLFNWIVFLNLIAATGSFALFLFILPRRKKHGGFYLTAVCFFVAVYSLFTALEYGSTVLLLRRIFLRFKYIGLSGTILFFVFFAARYCGKTVFNRPLNRFLLTLPAVIHVLVAFTNHLHYQLWSDFIVIGENALNVVYDFGWYYWILIAWIAAMTLYWTYLLLRTAFSKAKLQKSQAGGLLLVTLFPWIGSGMYILGLTPFVKFDTTPISLFLSVIALYWVLTDKGLLDLVPIARDLVVENMEDGVLVIDNDLRILDMNESAARLFQLDSKKSIGAYVSIIQWEEARKVIVRKDSGIELNRENAAGIHEYYEIDVYPIHSKPNKPMGSFTVVRDITDRKLAQEKLSKTNHELQNKIFQIEGLKEELLVQANHDSLTGLYNRRYLDDTIEREIEQKKREGGKFTVCMLDVDYFKDINDNFGHKAGDMVLRRLSEVISDNTRKGDIPCRFGGDEIVLIFMNSGAKEAAKKLEAIQGKFQTGFNAGIDTGFHTTFSAGVSEFPKDATEWERLLVAADYALYEAKQTGRDKIVVFSEADMSES